MSHGNGFNAFTKPNDCDKIGGSDGRVLAGKRAKYEHVRKKGGRQPRDWVRQTPSADYELVNAHSLRVTEKHLKRSDGQVPEGVARVQRGCRGVPEDSSLQAKVARAELTYSVLFSKDRRGMILK